MQYLQNTFVSALLALIPIFVVPYVIGKFLLISIFPHVCNTLYNKTAALSIISWGLGILLLTYCEILMELFELRYLIALSPLIFTIISLVVFIGLKIGEGFSKHVIFAKGVLEECLLSLVELFRRKDSCLILTISLYVFALVHLFVPFGTVGTAWDIPSKYHQPVCRMLEDGYIDLNLRVPQIVLYSLGVFLNDVDVIRVSWFSPLILILIFSAGLYSFTFYILNDKYISCITVFVGLTINVGHHYYFTVIPYILRGNTTNAAIFPSIMLLILNICSRRKKKYDLIRSTSLFIIYLLVFFTMFFVFNSYYFSEERLGLKPGLRVYFIRPVISLMAFMLALIFSIIKRSKGHNNELLLLFLLFLLFITLAPQDGFLPVVVSILASIFTLILRNCNKRLLSALVYTSIVCLILFTMYPQLFDLLAIFETQLRNLTQLPFVGNSQFPNPQEKMQIFIGANGLPFLILFFSGLGSIMKDSKRKLYLAILVIILAVGILFYLLPIGEQTWRIMLFLSPIMAIVSLYPFYFYTKYAIHGTKSKGPKFRTLMINVIMLLLLVSISGHIIDRFSRKPNHVNAHSIWSKYEYKAAEWIKSNTGIEARIISDYNTMLAMNTLANKIWLIGNDFKSCNLPQEYREILNEIKNKVFLSFNAQVAYKYLQYLRESNKTESLYDQYYLLRIGRSIQHEKIEFYIVISYRTINWLENKVVSSGDVTWRALPYDAYYPPIGHVPEKYIEPFINSNNFDLVFQIDDKIYIFKMKNKS